MLTGHGDPADLVLGLETGADDYVIKPFNFRELLARVHSVLRRLQPVTAGSNQSSNQHVRFGTWIFDTAARSLKNVDGGLPELSAGELDILRGFLALFFVYMRK